MNIDKFIQELDEDRKAAIIELRKTVLENIPDGFVESVDNNMLHYNVPLAIYPDGYHCKKDTPLPFVSIASQKNFIALYHMGLYASENLSQWFEGEYPKYSKYKLNRGKSCIRFKNVKAIPYQLIAELMAKITVDDYIEIYENAIKS